MTEPTMAFALSTSPVASVGRTPSAKPDVVAVPSPTTVSGAELTETQAQEPQGESDPELKWLATAEARGFEGHWVALDPDTGHFLGLADTREQLRRWRQQDVSLLFVEPHRRKAR
jgi:hypothetical protein